MYQKQKDQDYKTCGLSPVVIAYLVFYDFKVEIGRDLLLDDVPKGEGRRIIYISCVGELYRLIKLYAIFLQSTSKLPAPPKGLREPAGGVTWQLQANCQKELSMEAVELHRRRLSVRPCSF